MRNNGPIKVFVEGNPYHRDLIRSTIASMNGFATLNKNETINDADLVYWIYGPGPGLRSAPLLIRQKPKLIVHWIGSDVLDYQRRPRKFYSLITRTLSDTLRRIKGVVHLAGSPWLADELATAGIQATFFPLTTIDTQAVRPANNIINKSIDFLSYIPSGRFNFYGGDKLIMFAKDLPESSFLVIMPDVIDICDQFILTEKPANVRLVGKTDPQRMPDIYSRTKCFLRFTEHDGLSLSVLEAMFHKLQVFWTYKFPHVIHVQQFEGLQQILQETLLNWQPNDAGHTYVVDHYSMDVWKVQFREMFSKMFG